MKRVLTFACISILLSVLFSCRKNSFGTGGTITATVNGVPYASASVNGENRPNKNPFSIFSSVDNTHTTSIILYVDSLTPGVYSYTYGSGNALQYNSNGTTYATVPGSTGSIIITSGGAAANSITGTFSGVVVALGDTNAVVITDGAFTGCAY